MATINFTKELAEADSPLLLFACQLPDGSSQFFSTHTVTFNGNQYAPRVLKHNLFDFQLSSEDAMDGIAQLSLTLANADSALSEVWANTGWKGTQITVYLAFCDLVSGDISTESIILFRGIAGDPDEVTVDTLQLTFTNKLSLLRLGLPEVRIQRLCPWAFPSTDEQRGQSRNSDRFSRFSRCGYSPDIVNGLGNLNGSEPFSNCDHSRKSCEQRGMFSSDSRGNSTARFGGFEFVPSNVLVRGFGDKVFSDSKVVDNTARYNDFVPMVYGTGWLQAPIVFARNDGNLTHIEALLTSGAMDRILKVVVSGVEIPLGIAGTDMTATGWYNQVSSGSAQGSFNLDFVDESKKPVGDPHGSIAVISIVVPNRINTGGSLPRVEVLLQGLLLDRYNLDGSFRDNTFTNNPAWIILDVLRRAGWWLGEVNLPTFARSAAYCDELIATTDLNENTIFASRFHCNLILTKRKSAAEVIRGVRVGCGLMLRYGVDGFLELLPETDIARQHPSLSDGSNATETLNGGWPAYEFSDGSGTKSGIARDSNGRSSVKMFSRGIAELSNRLSVEFQDESNEYQQDSLSVVSDDDQALIGYETGSVSTALGLPNFSQAARVLSRQLTKLLSGNRFVEFETSFRALKLRPGDIITFTYLKEGLTRVPFRVIKLTPSLNFRRVLIAAQIHDDEWYGDISPSSITSGRLAGATIHLPRPLLGTSFDSDGSTQFAIQETSSPRADGGATTTLRVDFFQPTKIALNAPNPPLLSLSPTVSTGGARCPWARITTP